MKVNFIHCADIHLGFPQYALSERFDDFGRAFLHVTEEAVRQQVNFLLVAGDLFHKRAVEPRALAHAITGLDQRRAAGIPVIAVEGNHERPHYREAWGWLDFLDEQGFLHLLSPRFEAGVPIMEPHRRGKGGAYVDVGGVRIYGVKYYGAATSRVLEALAQALPKADSAEYRIALLHGGLEGVLPHMTGTLAYDEVAPLRRHVDYLALGHVHKPFEREGWVYNPGSLETVSIDEVQWPERGYYAVEVDTSRKAKHQARLVACPRRAFVRLSQDVSRCGSPTKLYDAVTKLAARTAREKLPQPVVEIELRGHLPFNAGDLDLAEIERPTVEAFGALKVIVRNAATAADVDMTLPEAGQSRVELEHQVLADLFGQDARFRRASDRWAEVAVEVKQMALADTSPAGIMGYVRQQHEKLMGKEC
jgi:DNA repair protein SbcD/Mre11